MTKSSIEFMTLEDRSKFDHMAITVMAEGLRIEGMEFQNMIDRAYNAEQQLSAASALIKDKDKEIASLRKDVERVNTIISNADAHGAKIARQLFERRGNNSEMHLSEKEVANIIAGVLAAITKEPK